MAPGAPRGTNLIFDRLSNDQKNEAIRRLNEYIEGGQTTKNRVVKESGQRNAVKKMDGTATCVCCDR
jgi:hypothetical protein